MNSPNKQIITVLLHTVISLAVFAESPTGFVNPFIGTDNYGNTHPGATMPWGMVSVCPFNATEKSVEFDGTGVKSSSYAYKNGPITGFSHVNLSGVGCPDHGVVQLFPAKGDIHDLYHHHSSKYSDEKARPGYYSVFLDDHQISVEATATLRTGLSKYTFPEGMNHILIDLGTGLTNQKGASVEIVSDDEIVGTCTVGNFCNGHKGNRLVYFVAKFSRKADDYGIWHTNFLYKHFKRKSTGDHIGAYFSFDTNPGETILVKTGISWVSIENARENLDSEQPDFDFSTIQQLANESWEKELSRIKVSGGTNEDKTKFYTALYHCLLHPNLLQDVNGQYPAMNSGKILHTCSNRYTVFSLWDTYRNLHPLLLLIYPERQLEMVNSMLDMYNENGWLPKWELQGNETYVMVGDPAAIVIADTYQKGLRDFDVNLAYEALKKSAITPNESNPVRPGINEYMEHGFIPLGTKKVWGTLSTTLEYNLADWNIAQLAKLLNQPADYDYFQNRSLSYRNFYDPQFGMLRPLEADGTFLNPFDPTLGENFEPSPGYVEGTPWQYTFFVPHDIPGLINLMGGSKKFAEKLQSFFDKELFNMNNEPDFANPYLFNYVKGEEWRSQKEVRGCIDRYFKVTPGGLPGNDDTGTLSAWLVFSMMGLYPDCPGKAEYALVSPVFDKTEIALNPNFYKGGKFVIETIKKRANSLFINRIKYNDKNISYFLKHDQITGGGTLKLYLTDKL